jgi:hypothetical protein
LLRWSTLTTVVVVEIDHPNNNPVGSVSPTRTPADDGPRSETPLRSLSSVPTDHVAHNDNAAN